MWTRKWGLHSSLRLWAFRLFWSLKADRKYIVWLDWHPKKTLRNFWMNNSRKGLVYSWKSYLQHAMQNIFIQIWQCMIWKHIHLIMMSMWFLGSIRSTSQRMRYWKIFTAVEQTLSASPAISGILLLYGNWFVILLRYFQKQLFGQAVRRFLTMLKNSWQKCRRWPELW